MIQKIRFYFQSLRTPKRFLLFLLKLGLFIALLFYIFKGLDFSTFADSFSRIPISAYFVIALIQLIIQVSQAFRWKVLTLSSSAGIKDYLGFVSLGYSMAVISPSIFLSDGANAIFMGRRHKTVVQSVSSMFIGRAMGLFVLFLCFLISLPKHLLFARELTLSGTKLALWLSAAIVISFSVFFIVRNKYGNKFHEILVTAKTMFTQPKRLAFGFLLSISVQMGQMIFVYLTYQFIQSPVTFWNVLFLVPVITFISIVPLTVGQIGVREGLAIFFLTQLPGVYKEHILAAAAFVYTLFLIFGSLNTALAYLLLKKRE